MASTDDAMRKLLILGLAALLAFALVVVSARGKWHVKGTVTSLDATHIGVKAKDGKTVKVKLTDKTKYRKGMPRRPAVTSSSG